METLICEKCSNSWTRQPSRGRKPRFCPSCVSTMTKDIGPIKTVKVIDSDEEKSTAKFPAPTAWRCSSCGVGIELKVNVDYAPTHSCKKRLKKNYPLELLSKK